MPVFQCGLHTPPRTKDGSHMDIFVLTMLSWKMHPAKPSDLQRGTFKEDGLRSERALYALSYPVPAWDID